jgi:hypothetical protein
LLRKDRQLSRLIIIAAIALIATAAAQASSRGPFLNNCGKLVMHPKTFTIACGDGNYLVKSLKWSSWGGRAATARGKASVNTCKPTCAAGTFRSYAVKVTASRRTTCGRHREYMRLTVRYLAAHPKGIPITDVQKLACR